MGEAKGAGAYCDGLHVIGEGSEGGRKADVLQPVVLDCMQVLENVEGG